MFSGYKIDKIINNAQDLIKEHNYQDALKELEKGLEIDDKDAYLNLFLGIVYFHLEDFEKAKEYLEYSADILKVDALPELYIGRIYIENKKYEEAINILKQGIKKDKLHPDLHYYCGMAYLGLNDFERATQEFELVFAERREFVWARILALLEWKHMYERD